MVTSIDRKSEIRAILSQYHEPNASKAWSQILNTFIPFGLCWSLMVYSLSYSYSITLGLALLTAGFLLRIFGIQHDCGHGSFFKSKQANEILGCLCSVFTLTPYHYWLKSHAYHHAHTGDLDHQDTGYINQRTVKDYLAMSQWDQLKYRLYRSPFILFFIGPVIKFVLLQRFTYNLPLHWKKERLGVQLTNLAILASMGLLSYWVGFKTFVLVHTPVVILTSCLGVWIFYIQHMFEDSYFSQHADWDPDQACLAGCSHYDLPKLLQWFSINNGIHHIHHLDSRIPNYFIDECYRQHQIFQSVRKVPLSESFKCMTLALWDEDEQKLISFADLKRAVAS